MATQVGLPFRIMSDKTEGGGAKGQPLGITDGAVWVNHGTAAMAAATPAVKDAICPWRYIRKASERQRPIIFMVCSDIPARCKVMAPPERRE